MFLSGNILAYLLFTFVKTDGIATILNSTANISGQFLISQETNSTVMLVRVNGLQPFSIHGLHIYAKSDNCYNAQDHYNPENKTHGGLLDDVKHAGDLGNIQANGTGSVLGKVQFDARLSALEGLSVGITERQDDTGRSNSTLSKINGNTGKVIACGVVFLNRTIVSSGSPQILNAMTLTLTTIITMLI